MRAFLQTFPKFVRFQFKPFVCFSQNPLHPKTGSPMHKTYNKEAYQSQNETFQNLPDKDQYHLSFAERNEIEARIMKILSFFEKVNLKTFKWTDNLEKDLKMDSLDQTVLLTSVEEEFNIVFEDRVFDNFQTLEDVVKYLVGDSLTI